MPADTIVILLIWLFYALECVAWDKKGVIYFRTLSWKSWRIVRPGRLLEGAASGLAFLFPVPPLGVQAPAYLPRVALSPEGLCVYVPESGDPAPGGETDHYLYEEIDDLGARGNEIIVNKRPFVRARSKSQAAEMVTLIRKIKGSRIKDREKLIEDEIKGRFDRSKITTAVDAFKEKTAGLWLLCNILWLALIAGLPAFIFIYGLSKVIVPPLAFVLLLHLAVTGMAFRIDRAIYGTRGYPVLLTLLPSPFHSVRATDLLAKRLLAGFHPFAVAGALSRREMFAAYAKGSLARVTHPSYDPLMPAKARDIDQWYKRGIIRSMEVTLRAMEIDIDRFRLPELDGKEAAYASYCPRCHGLYEREDGACADCPDMRLVPLKNRRKEPLT